LDAPAGGKPGGAWTRAWVNAAHRFDAGARADGSVYRIVQDTGTGMALTGGPDWRNVTVSTTVRAHLAEAIGILACVRGLRRHVSLTLGPDGTARLVATRDDKVEILAEAPCGWHLYREYRMSITSIEDGSIRGVVDDGKETVFLEGGVPFEDAVGGIGLSVTVGNGSFGPVRVEPAS